MSRVQTAPYGSWKSPITSDLIVAESISLGDVLFDGDDVYWLEGRPREGGRSVVVRRGPGGKGADLTPAAFNARTRVHEYGGGAVTAAGGVFYASNYADQRLYRVAPGSAPVPLTPDTPDAALRYADGFIDGVRNRWVGVREDHRVKEREAMNTLVAVDLAAGGEGQILAEGYDFYSSPRLSPDGRRLAWLSWRHPHMPWVETELCVADFLADGSLGSPGKVAGGAGESIFQPEWSPDGALYFISDRSGWWNLYRQAGDAATALCPLAAEFGQPQWNFGLSTYAFVSAERLMCTYIEGGLGRLAALDVKTGKLTPLHLPYTEYASLRARGRRVAFRAGSATEPASVVLLDLTTGRYDVLRTATAVAADPMVRPYFTKPRAVAFPTEGGKTAHGLYYPPHNPDYAAPAGEKPPLVVRCHGGPTGSADSTLNLRIQFWTSRGVAVLDVNYGGSTGYGREYRDRLHLTWGIVDVDDCVNGAKHLARLGLADGDRTAITGGSAGGYTTLAALTFRDFFKAGGSHYGVSDAGALARDTHKFESRYLDWLIGPYPEKKDLYEERSALFHVGQLKSPVIFFQGDEDRVVPPDQAEKMVEALRDKGIPVAYLLFAGEQHGFRKAENIKRSLDAELYFFAVQAFRVGLRF